MSGTDIPNAEGAEYWSSEAGRSWIQNEAAQDALLAAATRKLLELADFAPGQSVIDIGCGTGAHALAVAEAISPGGHVLATDISGPLLERAAERFTAAGAPVQTQLADAQVADFPGPFDAATSRFGVMFFENPAAAFANIARAIRPGGRMLFAAWGPVAVNPMWRLPAKIASEHLGSPPPVPPNAPGPMGLADIPYTERMLARAGFAEFSVTPTPVTLLPSGDAEAMAELSVRVGPASRVINHFQGTEADAQTIREALARALADYEDADGLAIPATLNIINVRLP